MLCEKKISLYREHHWFKNTTISHVLDTESTKIIYLFPYPFAVGSQYCIKCADRNKTDRETKFGPIWDKMQLCRELSPLKRTETAVMMSDKGWQKKNTIKGIEILCNCNSFYSSYTEFLCSFLLPSSFSFLHFFSCLQFHCTALCLAFSPTMCSFHLRCIYCMLKR